MASVFMGVKIENKPVLVAGLGLVILTNCYFSCLGLSSEMITERAIEPRVPFLYRTAF